MAYVCGWLLCGAITALWLRACLKNNPNYVFNWRAIGQLVLSGPFGLAVLLFFFVADLIRDDDEEFLG